MIEPKGRAVAVVDQQLRVPQVPKRRRFDGRSMATVVFFCLVALAVNSVLIQTVVPDGSSLKNLVRVGVLGLAAFALVLSNARVPPFLVVMAGLSIALLAFRHNPDQLSYVFVFVLVPALWSIPERRLVRTVMWGSLGALALVFALLGAGITHNEILDLRNRATYGTHGVPFFFNIVYGAATMTVYYTQKYQLRRRGMVLLGCLAVTTYLFVTTDARGGYLAFLAFVVLLWAVPFMRNVAAFRGLTRILPAAFIGLAFLIASAGDRSDVNQLMSNRPMFYARFIENVSLGDYLQSTSVKQFDRFGMIVDNSYLHLLIGAGVVTCVVYLVLFNRAMRRLWELGRHIEIAFLVSACLYFNSESVLVRIELLWVILSWYLVLRFGQRQDPLEPPEGDPPTVSTNSDAAGSPRACTIGRGSPGSKVNRYLRGT